MNVHNVRYIDPTSGRNLPGYNTSTTDGGKIHLDPTAILHRQLPTIELRAHQLCKEKDFPMYIVDDSTLRVPYYLLHHKSLRAAFKISAGTHYEVKEHGKILYRMHFPSMDVTTGDAKAQMDSFVGIIKGIADVIRKDLLSTYQLLFYAHYCKVLDLLKIPRRTEVTNYKDALKLAADDIQILYILRFVIDQVKACLKIPTYIKYLEDSVMKHRGMVIDNYSGPKERQNFATRLISSAMTDLHSQFAQRFGSKIKPGCLWETKKFKNTPHPANPLTHPFPANNQVAAPSPYSAHAGGHVVYVTPPNNSNGFNHTFPSHYAQPPHGTRNLQQTSMNQLGQTNPNFSIQSSSSTSVSPSSTSTFFPSADGSPGNNDGRNHIDHMSQSSTIATYQSAPTPPTNTYMDASNQSASNLPAAVTVIDAAVTFSGAAATDVVGGAPPPTPAAAPVVVTAPAVVTPAATITVTGAAPAPPTALVTAALAEAKKKVEEEEADKAEAAAEAEAKNKAQEEEADKAKAAAAADAKKKSDKEAAAIAKAEAEAKAAAEAEAKKKADEEAAQAEAKAKATAGVTAAAAATAAVTTTVTTDSESSPPRGKSKMDDGTAQKKNLVEAATKKKPTKKSPKRKGVVGAKLKNMEAELTAALAKVDQAKKNQVSYCLQSHLHPNMPCEFNCLKELDNNNYYFPQIGKSGVPFCTNPSANGNCVLKDGNEDVRKKGTKKYALYMCSSCQFIRPDQGGDFIPFIMCTPCYNSITTDTHGKLPGLSKTRRNRVPRNLD